MRRDPRPNHVVLTELCDLVDSDRGRHRLHVNPADSMWIAISVGRPTLSPYVQVVPDPAVPSGHGWYETVPPERWRELQSLVGQRVKATFAEWAPVGADHHDVGCHVGTLVRLTDREAVVDLGGDGRRYLPWITLEAAA